VFIEVIQRNSFDGFGAGNFKSLFEAFERELPYVFNHPMLRSIKSSLGKKKQMEGPRSKIPKRTAEIPASDILQACWG
jgi:hypothetical protein